MNQVTQIFVVFSLAFAGLALVMFLMWRADRKGTRAYLACALAKPDDVRDCWLAGPDGDGFLRLQMQLKGTPVRTVGGHFDCEALATRLQAAGIAVADRRTSATGQGR